MGVIKGFDARLFVGDMEVSLKDLSISVDLSDSPGQTFLVHDDGRVELVDDTVAPGAVETMLRRLQARYGDLAYPVPKVRRPDPLPFRAKTGRGGRRRRRRRPRSRA